MVQQLLLLHLLDGVSQIKFDIRFHEFLLEFLFIYGIFFRTKRKSKYSKNDKKYSKHNLPDLEIFLGILKPFL